MNKVSKILMMSAVLVCAGAVLSEPVRAAEGAVEPPDMQWSFDGPFGTYDKAALQRGYKVYREVCASCHGMKRMAYRHLSGLGYTEDEIKSIAAGFTVMDGPNEEGEMVERPAKPSDYFKSPFPNDAAAKYANNGALPPDLSLITKARHGGADYVYGILIGYEPAPQGKVLGTGQHWNKYMPGHVIAMAAPFSDGQIAYEDDTPQTVDQYARDVSHFLTYVSEPEMEDRKRMGVKVLLFLVVFAGILYATKRKIWAKLH